MHIPRAFIQTRELDEAINDLRPRLGPNAVHLEYTLGEDWTGDEAIFFTIVLTDRASQRDQLLNTTNQVMDAVRKVLQPIEQWGVLPYFTFHSESEHAALKEARK